MAVIAAEDGTPLLNEAEIAARWESIFFQEFSGRGERVQPKDLESRQQELRIPCQAQLRPEEWPGEDQLAADACDALGRMRKIIAMAEDCVLPKCLSAAGPGYLRAFARLALRSLQEGVPSRWRTGCMVPMAKKPRVPLSGKIHSKIVRTKIQHLPPEAAKGRQSGGIKGGSTSVPQIVLSFFIEKMRKERKCAAVLFTDSVFAEVALGGLLPFDTREQLFDKAGLSGQIRQVVRDLLAEDAVVTRVWNRCGGVQRRTGTVAALSE